MAAKKTRGGIGSNQYQTKPPTSVNVDLSKEAASVPNLPARSVASAADVKKPLDVLVTDFAREVMDSTESLLDGQMTESGILSRAKSINRLRDAIMRKHEGEYGALVSRGVWRAAEAMHITGDEDDLERELSADYSRLLLDAVGDSDEDRLDSDTLYSVMCNIVRNESLCSQKSGVEMSQELTEASQKDLRLSALSVTCSRPDPKPEDVEELKTLKRQMSEDAIREMNL